MTVWNREDIALATGGMIMHAGDKDTFGGFGLDSRTIEPGEVYIAIKGENHDGHSFVPQVLAAGIKGVIIESTQAQALEEAIKAVGAFCIMVGDTRYALGEIARYHRRRTGTKILALTGSAGKTSTRLMTTLVLQSTFNTWNTQGNFNNDIGVPLTLLGLQPEHEWCVLEMGANHPCEIARLCEIAEPEIAVITNIGPAHLEGFGTIEGVRDAKSEIMAKIPQNGAIILNGDDLMLQEAGKRHPARVIRYGFSEGNDIFGHDFANMATGVSFNVTTPGGGFNVSLNTPGRFMAQNALAAAAAGWFLGVSGDKTTQALSKFETADKRLKIGITSNGVKVINDSYNANPLSMEAAMGVLAEMDGRKIMVMGSMGELGPASAELHEEMGRVAAGYGFDKFMLTGDFTEFAVKGAADGGMDMKQIVWGARDDVMTELLEAVKPGDCVLIKGSRSMHMEDFVACLFER